MQSQPENGAAALYEGDRGAEYHDRRAAARSDEAQLSRTVYFAGVTSARDVVLDFGCGTGGVLARLPAARRVGIEVNEKAAEVARGQLDEVHPTLAAIADAAVDRIVSFHALEHVEAPIATFRELRRVLKPGGRARLIVPLDDVFLDATHRRWRAGDPDMHLYGWTPLTLGNALATAGFDVETVRIEPFSGGGKLASLFRGWPRAHRLARWLKALGAGRLQLVADVGR